MLFRRRNKHSLFSDLWWQDGVFFIMNIGGNARVNKALKQNRARLQLNPVISCYREQLNKHSLSLLNTVF